VNRRSCAHHSPSRSPSTGSPTGDRRARARPALRSMRDPRSPEQPPTGTSRRGGQGDDLGRNPVPDWSRNRLCRCAPPRSDALGNRGDPVARDEPLPLPSPISESHTGGRLVATPRSGLAPRHTQHGSADLSGNKGSPTEQRHTPIAAMRSGSSWTPAVGEREWRAQLRSGVFGERTDAVRGQGFRAPLPRREG
jgi:hypothetical protein